MTATSPTPHLGRLDALLAAGLEVDRLLGRLRGLGRRLVGAHRHLDRPGARTPLGYAFIRRTEEEYDEVLGQLQAARRKALALIQIG